MAYKYAAIKCKSGYFRTKRFNIIFYLFGLKGKRRCKRKRETEQLCYRQVKLDEVSSILKNYLSYFAKNVFSRYLLKMRFDDESAMLHKQYKEFLEQENLRNYIDLQKNFQAHFGLHDLFCKSLKQKSSLKNLSNE